MPYIGELMSNNIIDYSIDLYDNLNDLSDVDPHPRAFLSLLLHVGYLTRVVDDVYKIPNIEVKTYFYKGLLPKWMEKKFKTSFNESIMDDLADSIEVGNRYLSIIQSKLLDDIDPGDKTEADFQALLGGISNYASILHLPHAKHVPHCEVPVRGKKLDCMFTPLDCMSQTVIIHEYKKLNKSDDVEEQLEDALWQICANRYMNRTIDLFHKDQRNKHWKKIIMRAMVFFKNELNGKWNVMMREYEFSMSQAQQLDEAFSKEFDLDKLFGETEPDVKHVAREQFLNEKNSTLDLFLQSFFRVIELSFNCTRRPVSLKMSTNKIK